MWSLKASSPHCITNLAESAAVWRHTLGQDFGYLSQLAWVCAHLAKTLVTYLSLLGFVECHSNFLLTFPKTKRTQLILLQNFHANLLRIALFYWSNKHTRHN